MAIQFRQTMQDNFHQTNNQNWGGLLLRLLCAEKHSRDLPPMMKQDIAQMSEYIQSDQVAKSSHFGAVIKLVFH
jgi:hypothetical protein